MTLCLICGQYHQLKLVKTGNQANPGEGRKLSLNLLNKKDQKCRFCYFCVSLSRRSIQITSFLEKILELVINTFKGSIQKQSLCISYNKTRFTARSLHSLQKSLPVKTTTISLKPFGQEICYF